MKTLKNCVRFMVAMTVAWFFPWMAYEMGSWAAGVRDEDLDD